VTGIRVRRARCGIAAQRSFHAIQTLPDLDAVFPSRRAKKHQTIGIFSPRLSLLARHDPNISTLPSTGGVRAVHFHRSPASCPLICIASQTGGAVDPAEGQAATKKLARRRLMGTSGSIKSFLGRPSANAQADNLINLRLPDVNARRTPSSPQAIASFDVSLTVPVCDRACLDRARGSSQPGGDPIPFPRQQFPSPHRWYEFHFVTLPLPQGNPPRISVFPRFLYIMVCRRPIGHLAS
jgi:hypothetical protein